MFRHQDLLSTSIRNCDIKTCTFRRPANKVKGQIYVFVIVFFVIVGPKIVYLDTKIIFPSDSETEILRHVYSGGHFDQRPIYS